jgi:TrmH family RNA methyltransferase
VINRAGDKSTLVQRVRRLVRQRSARRDEGVYIVEGPKLVREALEAGRSVEVVLVPESATDDQFVDELDQKGISWFEVSEQIFSSLSSTRTPQPALAVLDEHLVSLADLTATGGLLLVLAEVADPGNAGTLIRSAESFGAAGVVFAGGVDPFNPKVVRASAGSSFRLPIVCLPDPLETVQALTENGYACWAAVPEEGIAPEEVPTDQPVAVVVGNEPRGLAAEVQAACGGQLQIPTSGQAESLNVAVAGSVALYALSRR